MSIIQARGTRAFLNALRAVAVLGIACGQPSLAHAQAVSEQEAHAIAVDAYLYFYSLITMDLTRLQFTNVKEVGDFKGPMNVFVVRFRFQRWSSHCSRYKFLRCLCFGCFFGCC